MSQKIVTIERHIVEGERAHPGASGDFSGLLRDLTLAFKVIWREVSKAGLVNILGFAGKQNIHGEEVKKLDVFAHETIYKAMDHGGHLCVMASEEEEDVLHIPDNYPTGKYVLLYDPLDGSSNIDANVTIGTIFSIYRRITRSGKGTVQDCLQPGYKQIGAGYCIYGSSTMLVYTTGDGVHGFTFDPSIGEFLLSHENIRIPKQGKIYSVNEGNYRWWYDGVKKYVKYLQEEDKATNRPYSGRYVGSMVADVHRTLLYGGIFMYPGDTRQPDGKLRLMYEANPTAFIIEQAGGRSSNGTQRILDIQPKALHQRTPLFIGSDHDVEIVEEFIQGKRDLTPKGDNEQRTSH
ncbi:MAG TPA: class 1 fructose-bisphosphatase [Bacteroidota bacterium]|nr:class 1 fructose-bisphosphatase [Bacteroidota bacterium]